MPASTLDSLTHSSADPDTSRSIIPLKLLLAFAMQPEGRSKELRAKEKLSWQIKTVNTDKYPHLIVNRDQGI